jgi:hypothetical protein
MDPNVSSLIHKKHMQHKNYKKKYNHKYQKYQKYQKKLMTLKPEGYGKEYLGRPIS